MGYPRKQRQSISHPPTWQQMGLLDNSISNQPPAHGKVVWCRLEGPYESIFPLLASGTESFTDSVLVVWCQGRQEQGVQGKEHVKGICSLVSPGCTSDVACSFRWSNQPHRVSSVKWGTWQDGLHYDFWLSDLMAISQIPNVLYCSESMDRFVEYLLCT